MLNAPINVVFFRCLCHWLFKKPGVETLRFYGFSPVCGVPVCGDFDGILRFFPCGWASVCEDFEILRFFRCVWGPCVWGLWDFTLFYLCVRPLCVGSLRFYAFVYLCVGPLCVWGLWDFTALRFYGTLRFCIFPLCVGPVLETLKIFKKKSPIGKNPRCGDLKWQ